MMMRILVMQFAVHDMSAKIDLACICSDSMVTFTATIDTRPNCMECMCTDNGDFQKSNDRVASRLHHPPCPNKKVEQSYR